uniref:Uncharacterized protein n=1 Tax=Anopheles albimanus TaxID=7167 RepID=A0A182FYH5_ANOAL
MKHIALFAVTTSVLLFINCFHTSHSAPAQLEQQGKPVTTVEHHSLIDVPTKCPQGYRLSKNKCVQIKPKRIVPVKNQR